MLSCINLALNLAYRTRILELLLRLLCSIDPRLYNAAVVVDPGFGTYHRVACCIDRFFEVVDLLLGERQRFYQRIGYGIVI
jgi:hypothetical protein